MIITKGPFKGMKAGHYKVIVVDPPWAFKARSRKGMGRSAENHYSTMSLSEIAKLPVAELADPRGCVLLMWITDPMLLRGAEMIENWGFTYKTTGFYWVKLTKKGTPHTGMGFWTRANPEVCEMAIAGADEDVERVLLNVVGQPKRQSKNVSRVILSERREHSRKPDEFYERVEALLDGPYLDLFSREDRLGWSSWGYETGKFNHDDLAVEDLI